MSELLAPAGSIDAFFAAISNGADAIYFGLNVFSARAYAKNFNKEECEFIVRYAHLRNVKVYCTMNTIVLEKELAEAFKTIDELAETQVDGIIVQDLALLDYITNNYSSLEAHVSTQVGIDDLEGIKFVKEMGATRVVLAREVSIQKIKEFKEQIDIQIETFVHGALCVSYSGNCFMSGLIGLRSGNRGRCVGSCRKLYTLLEEGIAINKSYLYSMKDLNTSEYIPDLKIIDSLKIEGRMKEASYVAGIVRYYRNLLDGKESDKKDLFKNFQRTFTKGYLFGEDPKDITNIKKPNNFGYLIGEVVNVNKKEVTIKLKDEVNQYDQIRIGDYLEEISFPLIKIYDAKNHLIASSNTIIKIILDEKVKVGDSVYKTKDVKYLSEIEKTYPLEYKRIPLNINVIAISGQPLILNLKYDDLFVEVKSDCLVEDAINHQVDEDNFQKLLSKLNDTPYYLNKLHIKKSPNIFIPLGVISNLKRALIDELNEERLKHQVIKKEAKEKNLHLSDWTKQSLSAEVETIEQYDACIALGIEEIYFKNKIRRNHVTYDNDLDNVLVGGLGGVQFYQGKNITTDYSLNVVNSHSLEVLLNKGVSKVTLSYELTNKDIKDLIEAFINKYGVKPPLEMIVYGRQKLMHTAYCPLKRLGMCGNCKLKHYAIEDDYEVFPLMFNEDCTTMILNSKILNLIDEVDQLKDIKSLRLSFTTETKEETKRIVKLFQAKLNGKLNEKQFDSSINTRGHFFREIV